MRFSRSPVTQKLALLHGEAEERDAERRAAEERLTYLDLKRKPINLEALGIIREEEARAAKVAVLEVEQKQLKVAAYSLKIPKTRELLNSLRERGFKPEVLITSLGGLNQAWSRYAALSKEEPRPDIVSELKLEETTLKEREEQLKTVADVTALLEGLKKIASTTEALRLILSSALILDSSDVHLEYPAKSKAIIRFRIDGVLRDVSRLPNELMKPIISRLKLLSKLKLNITDLPQDGRFTIETSSGPVEVRTSVVPAEFGEALVMRILNPETIAMELPALGLRADDEEIIERELKRPNGMILVTGPTGSGKTTTLYAFLKKIRTPAEKIITIEDPIEYHLEGIEQTQIEAERGYTFAAGLRSILRQDPDIILVGEIRDLETAETSIHAALTGHLVFSTLHTNNTAGAIPRLIDLGVKPAVIGPALVLVLAQRLVRRLCPKCREEIVIDKTLQEQVKKFLDRLPKRVSREKIEVKLYQARGCNECSDGFRGRIGVFELLEMGDELDSLIKKEAIESEIRELALTRQGMLLMQQDGILKALSGITTLEEVERATGPIEW